MLTRSKRHNKTDQDNNMSKKSKGKVSEPGERSQWVMMVPDELLNCSNDKKDLGAIFHKMPHPKSSQPTVYAFRAEKIYELMKFKENYRSWFINNNVLSDGSLYVLTQIDPLFLTLSFLDKIAATGKYMTLEQILIDKKYQSGLTKLENCLSRTELEKVCDFKHLDDFTAYKLSQEKVLAWLVVKVKNLAEHLKKESSLHVGSGSCASNFVKSGQKSENSQGEYMNYAAGLVSDYISESWFEKLKEKLNLQCFSPDMKNGVQENEPPPKRQKLSNKKDEPCIEDYRDAVSKPQTKKPAKLTSGQKQLAKVDKTGMKSLNSFFSPRQKEK